LAKGRERLPIDFTPFRRLRGRWVPPCELERIGAFLAHGPMPNEMPQILRRGERA
jgi:hypothetical protein